MDNADTLTDRDRRVLREVGALGAVPVAHLLGFFPTAAAGYVRLGVLARRGLVRRFSARRRRWVGLSASGAAAAGVTAHRGVSRITERRAVLIGVHCLLASCGYAGVPPPPAAPSRLQYYSREGEVVAVAVTARPLRRGGLRALTHPIIFSPAARIVKGILVFAPGTIPQRLHEVPDSWQSRVVLMPASDPTTAEVVRAQLVARLRLTRQHCTCQDFAGYFAK